MSAIEIQGVSKTFGSVQAVRDLSFTVDAGRVTGFLGPNGAGKSTTLRMLLGLIHADGGAATFSGPPLRRPRPPERPGRRRARARELPPGAQRAQPPARARRRGAAIPTSRVDEVLEQVGLTDAADRRVKGYSMGMRQRLAIAAALLGDPEVLILDEPVNGLDPPGIRWIRGLLREQAGRGRAVLVSSHLLSEVAQSVDDVVVIAKRRAARGRPARRRCSGSEEGEVTRVRTQDAERLAELLRAQDVAVEADAPGALLVRSGTEVVGVAAAEHRIVLTELVPRGALARGGVLRAHGGGGMRPLLQAELIKLRTTRTFIALTAIAVGISILITVLVASITEPTADEVLGDVFTSDTSGLFIIILAVIGITGEWRHHTITSSLLAAPDRVRFLAAKLIAFAIAGLVLSAADLDRDRDRRAS